MLCLQFILYSSSFVVSLENEIPGAALEPCQLKSKQFSPDILKFSTKHKDNPFTLNCFMLPRTFLFIFDAGSRRLGSNNFQNSSYKEKTAGSARVSRLSFRFLWLCLHWSIFKSMFNHFSVINNLCDRHNTIKALFKTTLNCIIVKCLNNTFYHRYLTKFLKMTVYECIRLYKSVQNARLLKSKPSFL